MFGWTTQARKQGDVSNARPWTMPHTIRYPHVQFHALDLWPYATHDQFNMTK